MPIQEWNIQSPADHCSITGKAFAEDEIFYSILRREDGQMRRQDFSEEAWLQNNSKIVSFCFWKSVFKIPVPPPSEPLKKSDAESLLRHFLAENDPSKRNACYILALMLERKRLLKPIEVSQKDGVDFLVYEHVQTGESFLVVDPHLRLDQLTGVQDEVAQLLAQPVLV